MNKWYSLSVAETEKILRTNAASGLSRKAARSRMKQTGGNSFFFVESRSIKNCIFSVLADPMLLLLIGVDIIAAIFGETAIAVTVGVLILVNLFATFFTYIRSQRIIEFMSGYSQPKVRVIRNGELFLADSRCIVPGDLLLLGRGDVLPCDARIVSSSGLIVNVYTGRNGDPQNVTVASDANVIYSENLNLQFYEHLNILYAGSEIKEGEARAIAVETGENTYIGVLDGGIPLNDIADRPEILLDMKRFSWIYSLGVLLMVLPFAIIGIFTYGTDSLLTTFMLILALAVSSLGELIYVLGNIITATAIYDGATGYGKHNLSFLKSVKKSGTLAKVDRVILSGKASLTDGKPRVTAVYANGLELRGKAMFDESVIPAAECFLALMQTATAFPRSGAETETGLPSESFADFSIRLGVDEEQMRIGVSPISFSCGRISSASYIKGGRNVSVSVSTDIALLDRCDREEIGGETVLIGSERRAELRKTFDKLASEGNKVYTIAVSVPGGEMFKGMFALKEIVPNTIKEKISRFKQAGVIPVLFVDREDPSDAYLAIEAGIAESRADIAFASNCRSRGLKIEDIAESAHAFLGFSAEEKLEYEAYFRKAGHISAVFATSADDYELFEKAAVSITADRSSYDVLRDDFERLETYSSSGSETSPDGAQNLRVSADMLVHRANLRGGGVCGIYNAIATARRTQKNLVRAVTYLLCSQLVRFIFVIPSILFGQILLSPFHLLFGGLIVDFGAILVLALDRHEKTVMQKPFVSISLKNPLGLCRKMLVMTAMSAGSEVITALITAILGKGEVSGAVFISVTVSQLILLFILRFADARTFAENRTFVMFSAFVATAVAVLTAIPYLASLTVSLFSIESIICVCILPLRILVWFVYRRILMLIKRKKNKKRGL